MRNQSSSWAAWPLTSVKEFFSSRIDVSDYHSTLKLEKRGGALSLFTPGWKTSTSPALMTMKIWVEFKVLRVRFSFINMLVWGFYDSGEILHFHFLLFHINPTITLRKDQSQQVLQLIWSDSTHLVSSGALVLLVARRSEPPAGSGFLYSQCLFLLCDSDGLHRFGGWCWESCF